MKFIPLLLLLVSCNLSQRTNPPDDVMIEKIIREHYTADNAKDGGEYCSIEQLQIIGKKMNGEKCEVSYHISCSFSGPALPEEYQRQRPSINADSTAILVKQKEGWQMEY